MARLAGVLCLLSSLPGPFPALKYGSAKEDPQFLLVSSPHFGQVSYVQVPAGASDPSNYGTPQPLIATGLTHPQGIAYDRERKRLLIADPDVKQILAYTLGFDDDGSPLVSSGPFVVCTGVESRWVSVDENGDVLFSDEPANMILKVAAADVLGSPDKAPEVLFNGGDMAQVSEPGGVAVDAGNVYWTNKHYGTIAGSVIRGHKTRAPGGDVAGAVSVLATNTERSYGICIARGRLYYTDASLKLYSLSLAASAGSAVELSRSLSNPRGCAADEDGHVFLADRGAGAVYFVETSNHTARLTRVFDHQDAFGVAVARRPAVSLSAMTSQQMSGLSGMVSDGLSGLSNGLLGKSGGQLDNGLLSKSGKSDKSDGQAESSRQSGCPWMGIGPCSSALRMQGTFYNILGICLLLGLF
eukprot:TRINITY_DN91555_c0_g1_i1.p1 TRINITY_DN91555_c0_g1~~TRINITY_DN91555_c0_g1_i1.p1  ORF type:complete len:413 (+),score=63.01 TRINITY_DN91555_c0_g1_i1:103-1341(+)